MRAGLLSDPEVINRLNKEFVNTTIIIDDLEKWAAKGDELAKRLSSQWEYPVELILATPDGRPVSKLNSFKDFPGMHPDVSAPPGNQHHGMAGEQTHSEIFLKQLDLHFSKD